MGVLEGLLLLGFVVGIVAVLIHFARTRSRVMGYHHIPTPRINETTRDSDGGSP
jgi:hypothetical protein